MYETLIQTNNKYFKTATNPRKTHRFVLFQMNISVHKTRGHMDLSGFYTNNYQNNDNTTHNAKTIKSQRKTQIIQNTKNQCTLISTNQIDKENRKKTQQQHKTNNNS